MNFIVFVNYYLIGGAMPSWQAESTECLKISVNRARSAGIQICVIVRVSESDYNYFLEYFSDIPYIYVEKLQHSSLNRKLPFLADILSISEKSEKFSASILHPPSEKIYCIYKNADICIPNYFFEFISMQIAYQLRQVSKGGGDCGCSKISFIINRKNIIESSNSGKIISGDCKIKDHPGYDMFVFEDSIREKLCLEEVAVGNPPVGAIMAINLLAHSEKVQLIDNLLITWHRGEERSWKQNTESHEAIRNRDEAMKSLQRLFTAKQDVAGILDNTFGFERIWIRKYLDTQGHA